MVISYYTMSIVVEIIFYGHIIILKYTKTKIQNSFKKSFEIIYAAIVPCLLTISHRELCILTELILLKKKNNSNIK